MSDVNSMQHPVILYDGVCNLCNGIVQFVIKRDKKQLFKFASLQSAFGEAVLQKHHLSGTGFNSFILLQNGKVYTKSTGALMVAGQLSGAWSLLGLFRIIPSFIRDRFYDIIAKNRYKWFGKEDTCTVPSPELKIRFFD
jgi:predicted DCC family thiol-disulfide oxidoreductase YuxK